VKIDDLLQYFWPLDKVWAYFMSKKHKKSKKRNNKPKAHEVSTLDMSTKHLMQLIDERLQEEARVATKCGNDARADDLTSCRGTMQMLIDEYRIVPPPRPEEEDDYVPGPDDAQQFSSTKAKGRDKRQRLTGLPPFGNYNNNDKRGHVSWPHNPPRHTPTWKGMSSWSRSSSLPQAEADDVDFNGNSTSEPDHTDSGTQSNTAEDAPSTPLPTSDVAHAQESAGDDAVGENKQSDSDSKDTSTE
jgi:hypothetical protein